MEDYRLILGRTPANPETNFAITIPVSPPKTAVDGFKIKKLSSVGVAIVNCNVLFQWDKEEFDWFMEHERRQLNSIKQARTGDSTAFALSAAHLKPLKKGPEANAQTVLDLWNQVERGGEDFLRAAEGKKENSGDVSWNCLAVPVSDKQWTGANMPERFYFFWLCYSRAVSDNPKIIGSLGYLWREEKKNKTLREGTFAEAAALLDSIHCSIPPDWQELRTEQNGVRNVSDVRVAPYFFENPIKVIDKLSRGG